MQMQHYRHNFVAIVYLPSCAVSRYIMEHVTRRPFPRRCPLPQSRFRPLSLPRHHHYHPLPRHRRVSDHSHPQIP